MAYTVRHDNCSACANWNGECEISNKDKYIWNNFDDIYRGKIVCPKQSEWDDPRAAWLD